MPKGSDTPTVHRPGLGENVNKGLLAAFGITSLLSLLAVGAAGYESESNGVMAAYVAAFFVGTTLGAWRGLHYARNTFKGPAWIGIGAVLGGLLLPFLAIVFFEGIFPSL